MTQSDVLQQLQDLANDHELELNLRDSSTHAQLVGYTESGTKVVSNWWPFSRRRTMWIDTTRVKLTQCDLHDFVEQTLEAIARINATELRDFKE